MDEETTAPEESPTPHSAPADVSAALRLAGPRVLVVDDAMFHPGPGAGPQSASFRLQLFTAPGLRPVAVVTAYLEDGPSLTNAAERYAAAVWERHCPVESQPPLWVQRETRRDKPNAGEWELVTFTEASEPYRLRGPRWCALSGDQLRQLVGRPVDTGRGAGYVPRPVVPGPELHFEVWPVRRLGRPSPFREPECMPTGASWWWRLLRHVRPTTRTRTCCWYHGGDWHSVCRHAVTVLAHARRDAVPVEKLAAYADRYAQALPISDWQHQALSSLFSLGNAVQPSSDGLYINGQHRAQALMDAGVRHTVVLVHR